MYFNHLSIEFFVICHVGNNAIFFVTSFTILLTFISLPCLLIHWLGPLVQH